MKILIADDHNLFLSGLTMVITENFPDSKITQAKDYTQIFDIIKDDKTFDLILTDLAMPGAKWLEAIEQIHKTLPDTPIMILSAVFDKEIVQKTFNLGAAGYIPKTSSNSVIISAINLVISGGVYIPPELLETSTISDLDIIKQTLDETQNKPSAIHLTPRQLDILKLIAKGQSNKQIAFELGLTEGTIKLYVTAILKTLNVYNRTGAVNEAQKMGLLK